MSRTIDERVVSMQFDNKQFEAGVQTSLSTLEKLKQSLNLTGASKGIENVNAAAKKFDLTPMGNAVETVGLKFSAWYTIADQTLRNIVNSVELHAKRIVSAFTIDPVKTGLQEYETQINAVQTILANTQSKGTTLDNVNTALDELNTYADKTIYNFTEMTRNIGTFTAAGVDLDKSVTSIKGIANLAAVSGSTSQQASTAMYQLSQALAAGKVQLMDWNSVVNAGMGGQVFQDALKRTATQMGTNVDAMIKKYGSFRESLTQGEWLTAEVLTETLTQLSGAYSEADLISQGYSEKQAKEIVELSKTAVDAATKVKTFTQLMDTLKEAAQSGWTQTWEILVGDFEDAKELWTGISDAVGGFINSTSEARNKLLSGAMDSNWEKLTARINEAGIETSTFEDKVKEVAKSHGVNVDALIKKHGSLEEAFQADAISTDILKEAVNGLSVSIEGLSEVKPNLKMGDAGEDVEKVQQALSKLGYDLGKTGVDGVIGGKTTEAIKAFQELKGLEVTGVVDEKTLQALDEATNKAADLKDAVGGLIDGVTELGGREMLIESFKNVFHGLKTVIFPITKAFKDIFPPATSEQLLNIIKGFRDFTSGLKLNATQMAKVYKVAKGFFSAIDIGWEFVKELAGGIWDLAGNVVGLADGALTAASSIGDWITGVRDSIKESNIFSKAIGGTVSFLQSFIDVIGTVASFIGSKIAMPGFKGFLALMQGIWSIVTKVGGKISEIGSSIGDAFANAFRSGDIEEGIDIVNGGLFAAILFGIKNFVGDLGDVFEGASGVLENVTGILDSVKGCFEAWQADLKANVLMKIAGAIGILAASILVISLINPEKLAGALGAITVLFADLMGAMAVFTAVSNKKILGATKAVTIMVGMSTAVLILAVALKKLSDMEWDELGKGLAGIAGLTAIVIGAAKLLGSGGKTVIKGATQMVIMAAAIAVLASTCKKIADMSWDELGRGLVGLTGMMAILVVAVQLISTKATTFVKGAGSMLIMAGALTALAGALHIVADLSWDDLTKGLVGLGSLLAGLVIAVKLMSTGAGTFIKGAGSMLVMSIALSALVGTMSIAGKMSWESIAKGLVAIGGAMAILAIGLNVMRGTLLGSAALLVATAGLIALTPALMALGSMSWESIGKGLIAVAGAIAILGVAGLILGPIVPAILGLGAAFALIGVSVLAVGAGLAAVAVGLGLLATAGATGATAIVAALTIIITGVAGLIPAVAQKFGEGVVEFCKAIGDSAKAIGGAIKDVLLAALDVITECAPDIAVGLLALISELLKALAEYTPQIVDSLFDFVIGLLDGFADRMPELIQAGTNFVMQFFSGIAKAIGQFDVSTLLQGAVGVGIMAGVMAALSAVAGLVPGAMIGVLGMGAVVAELAIVLAAIGALNQIPGLDWLISEGGDLLQGIGNAIGGFVGGIVGGIAEGITASLPQIGTDLSNFMTNLGPFLEGAKTIDETMLTNVGNLVDIVMAITGASLLESIASFITGTSSIDTFGTQLVSFGTAIKNFSAEVAGLDENAVTAAANAGSMLATMASTIPNTGGLVSFFTGDNDIATFGTQIVSFGTAIKNFATEVSGLDEEAITAATNAGSMLVALADTIPNTGGLISFLTGDNDLATFGTQLVTFGTAIKNFSAEVTGLDTEAVITAVTAGTALADLANVLPESGGLWSVFSADNDMSTFATEIVKFGKGISAFATSVAGIDTAAVDTAIGASKSFVTLTNTITAEGNARLAVFGSNLNGFGTNLKAFSKSIAKVDTATMTTVVTELSNLAAVDLSNLETLGTSLSSIGSDSVSAFIKSFTGANEKFKMAGTELMNKLISGMKSMSLTMLTTAKALVTGAVSNIKTYRDKFYDAGKYLVEGFAAGISENNFKAEAKAAAMASAALKAAKEALDEHSPSRESYKVGAFFGEGFINAIADYGTKSRRAGESIAESAKTGLSGAIARVRDMVEMDMDTQPTIRPVLDLSAVSDGANSINGMFNMSPSVGVMSNIRAINSMMNSRQNGISNVEVVSAIKDLGRKLGNISGDTYQIGDVSYDNGSEVSTAVQSLVRAAKIERRR